MPKETIGYDGNQTVVKWRRDDEEHAEFLNAPGHVSIAVLNPAIDDPDQTGAAGFYADLDADQIDYLIAVLRKAKRQAFPRSKDRSGITITMSPSSVPNGGPVSGYPIVPVWRLA